MRGIVFTVKFRLLLGCVLALVLAATATSPALANGLTDRHHLLAAINQARANHGLAPLRASLGLHRAAQRHTNDMINRDYFGHTSPTGSTLYARILTSGFVYWGQWSAGEDLAWGTGTYGTPRATVKMWLASPEHRAILLSSSYRLIGLGRATGSFLGHSGAVVWTADFAHR
jgi:uncharacterized protein YkwD